MRVGIGVADEEPAGGGACRKGLFAELGNRAGQQLVLESARTVELGEQPLAAGQAQPIGRRVRRQVAGLGGSCIRRGPADPKYKRNHQLCDEAAAWSGDPCVLRRRQGLLEPQLGALAELTDLCPQLLSLRLTFKVKEQAVVAVAQIHMAGHLPAGTPGSERRIKGARRLRG